jgi:hypothetical protein
MTEAILEMNKEIHLQEFNDKHSYIIDLDSLCIYDYEF